MESSPPLRYFVLRYNPPGVPYSGWHVSGAGSSIDPKRCQRSADFLNGAYRSALAANDKKHGRSRYRVVVETDLPKYGLPIPRRRTRHD